MNFTINQTNGIRETVNSEFINKLYNLFITNRSSHTISLSGYLYSPTGYKAQMDALNLLYGPDLVIEVPAAGLYIYFEDDAVLSALVSAGISSDGTGISADDLLVPTNLSQLGLSGNSNISSFTELSKFVNIRNNSTNFYGCTNLEWISLPNNDGNLNISFFISGGKKLKWVVPSVEFACSKEFNSWYNNPARGGGADTAWLLYDLNKQPITDVVIPNGVTSIGKYVFGKMSCNSLSIPSTITLIRHNAFENVSVIQGFSLNLHNLTGLSQNSFYGCTGLTSVTDLGSITYIPASCFCGCTSLTSVILPETCTSIGSLGFYQCSLLSEVTFPSSSTIDIKSWGAFYNCSNLTKINNLQNVYGLLYDRTFAGCPLTFNNLSELTNVTSFGSLSLNGSNISASGTTNLPNTTSIGGSAFSNCTNIKGELTFPNLTTLGESAFLNCTGITSIANLGDINTIPVNCFSGCTNLTSVIFPTTIRTLNMSCFNGCKIGQIILPYGYIGTGGWATVMRNSVGDNCRYLQYPSTILVVGTNDMFRDSGSNINCLIVVLATTPPTTGYDPNNTGGFGDGFSWGRPDKANWYVPDSVVNDYKSATGWSQFADKIYSILQLRIDSPTYWQVYQANKDYGVPAQS